jgi:hypothetical protein
VITLFFDAVAVPARMRAEVDSVPVVDVAVFGMLAPASAVAVAVAAAFSLIIAGAVAVVVALDVGIGVTVSSFAAVVAASADAAVSVNAAVASVVADATVSANTARDVGEALSVVTVTVRMHAEMYSSVLVNVARIGVADTVSACRVVKCSVL